MKENSIFTCEHPLRIRNKYDGKVYYVPCRKCNACRLRKSVEWSNRLNQESKCHPYSFFGTLTYSPKYLPYLLMDSDRKVLFSPSDSSVEYDFKDINLDSVSYEFIKRRKCLPVGDSKQVRKFIKRVRERIRSNNSGESRDVRYLRYFLVLEYGETCLRPHYHFLFFTASKWFAENAKNVVASCWTTDSRGSSSESLGRIDCQSVKTSASSYVASYLTWSDNLPKVYTFRKFRPFSVCSRQPPIGSLFESSEDIQELFSSGACTRTIQDRETKEFLDIPFPRSFCDRVYPRLKAFDRIPLDVLNRLYSEAVEASTRTFEEFKGYVRGRSEENTDVGKYYRELILPAPKRDLSGIIPEENFSALHQLFSTLNRFHIQRLNFGCSVGDYVSRIYDFWKRREYFMLKTQECFNERISKSLGSVYTLLVDIDLLSNFRNHFDDFLRLDDLSGFYDFMKSYGVYFYENSFSCEKFRLMSSKDDYITKRYFSKSDSIVSDCKKRHEKNDYLIKADLDKDLRDFLLYFNSIKHGNIENC